MKKYKWLVRPYWDENHPECKQFSSKSKAKEYAQNYANYEVVWFEWQVCDLHEDGGFWEYVDSV